MALPFTLRATPVPATATNYDGTPTSVTGFPGCGAPLAAALCATPGALSYTAGSWSAAGSGVRENATANYTEAGAFNLQLEDQTYANVDSVDGTPLATRTIPVTATVQVGRFVPDHFVMSPNNVPQLKTFNNAACAMRSFTYIGQPFAYVTAPQALVTAQNAANATTTNYSSSLWKIATAAGAQTCTTGPDTCALTSGSVTQSYTYTTTPVATPNWDSAQVVLTTPTVVANNNGTGTVTTSTTDTLAFRRSTTTPQNLFTASIVLTDSVTDSSENAVAGNGIITTTTPAAFSPIAFDSGNEFRYGRMRLSNAQGSEQLNLVIPVVTQYWNGSAFATNTADNCTILAANNIQLIAPPAGVSATAGGMFASGVGALTLTKPTIPAKFSVGLCVDLGVDVPLVCTAAAAAGAAYLQGAWTGANYTNDPSATATFGVYKGNNSFIYLRENY